VAVAVVGLRLIRTLAAVSVLLMAATAGMAARLVAGVVAAVRTWVLPLVVMEVWAAAVAAEVPGIGGNGGIGGGGGGSGHAGTFGGTGGFGGGGAAAAKRMVGLEDSAAVGPAPGWGMALSEVLAVGRAQGTRVVAAAVQLLARPFTTTRALLLRFQTAPS